MIILFKDFPIGRLGNNLFQIAYVKALSERLKINWALPKWDYSKYFQMKWNADTGIKSCHSIGEINFDYHEETKRPTINGNTTFHGYFQSEEYFQDVWDKIKYEFKFNENYLNELFHRTSFIPGKNDVAVHVRLGDFVGNKSHVQIPSSYYTDIFNKNKDKEYYIFSDDYCMCKKC